MKLGFIGLGHLGSPIARRLVEARFPALLGLAQQRVNALTNVNELTALLRQVLAASNEEAARSLLTSLAV